MNRDAIIAALSAYRIVRGSGVSEPLRAVDIQGIADAVLKAVLAPAEAPAPAPATARGGDAVEAENVRLKAALDAAIKADDVLTRAVWAEGELDRIVAFAAGKGVTIPRNQAASTAIVNLMKLIEAQGAALASQPQATGGAVEREGLARALYASRPAFLLHPEKRPLSWDEAVEDVPGRIATIYSDVDAILAAIATQPAPSPK